MKNWRLTRQSRADGPRAAAPCKGAACGPPLISDYKDFPGTARLMGTGRTASL